MNGRCSFFTNIPSLVDPLLLLLLQSKIWHEMGATIAMTAVCFQEVFKADFPPDIMPHCLTALLFSIWFGYLSREY